MDLEDLSLFVDAVRAGSITGAARKRAMPKSTASRRLRQLENRLGVRLLERSTRRLDLTEAGATLFERAAPFLDELEDIERSVLALQRTPKGHLAIRMPQELFAAQMGELIGEFLQQYPDVSLSCTQYSGATPSPSTEFDLELLLHDTALPASDWVAKPLLSIPQGLFAAPTASWKMPRGLAELGERPCILHAGESFWMFRIGAQIEAVPVRGRLVLNSPDMQLHAAVRGHGIVRLARYQAEAAVRRGALVELALEGRPLAQQLTALYRGRALPQKTRLFVEHFQSHLGRLYSAL